MATKNCPHCQKQVPVACKKCGCGHVFFSSRRNVGSSSESVASVSEVTKEEKEIETESLQPRRRTGRVQREKPNFYDALQYENQIRKQKMLLRKQVKSAKPDETQTGVEEVPKAKEMSLKREHDPDAGSSGNGGSKSQSVKSSHPGEESEPKKRRRGRPPGITGRKPGGGGARIHHNAPSLSNIEANQDKDGNKFTKEEEEEDIMADISPEKALQYHIVLQEINRKWAIAGWKAP